MSYLSQGNPGCFPGFAASGDDTWRPPKTISASDYNGMAIAQRNEAGKRYGYTNISQYKGGASVAPAKWPRMSAPFAISILDYWSVELGRNFGSDWFKALVFPPIGPLAYTDDSGWRDGWKRAVDRFKAGVTGWRTGAQYLGTQMVPDSTAALVWAAIDDIALRMKAVKQTPSHWSIFWESVKEEVEDRAKSLLKYALIAGAAIVGVNYFLTRRS